jgi:hypothetical protein
VFIRSEVLCFIQNNASSVARNVLISRVVGFFTPDEVSDAKTMLFTSAEKLKTNGLITIDIPRNISRRNGDGRRKAETDDIMDLWELLDRAKATLPTYCAVKLDRLPPLSFTDVDVCSLSAIVLDVRNQLNDVTTKLSELTTHVKASDDTVKKLAARPCAPSLVVTAAPTASSADPATLKPPTSADPSASRSWADRARQSPSRDTEDSDGFSIVSRKKVRQAPKQSVICGKKLFDDGSLIKAAPCRITAFVGRLDKDCTPEALSDYLSSCGIDKPTCKKLEARDGRVFKTSAFMVSCEAKYHDKLFDDSMWPAGCELRDWVFRKKEGDIDL